MHRLLTTVCLTTVSMYRCIDVQYWLYYWLSTAFPQVIHGLCTGYPQARMKDTPSPKPPIYPVYMSLAKKNHQICDEEVNESDIELIELFGVSLIDKDKDTMIDLMYVVEDKMSDECVCFENKCVCSMWK